MQLIANAKQQFIDKNGLPLANGTVSFYYPGTTNPKPTYQDSAGTIANTNPITLDSNGQALIWGSGTYRQIVKDACGVTIWDQITSDSNAGLLGNITDAKFVSGTDFTPGTTTVLTLPAAPGSVSNIWVFFDGVFQADDQIASLVDKTLTFNAAIPVGTQEVNVKIGTTIAVGTPSDGTVTAAKLANGAAAANLYNSAITQVETGQFWAQNGARIHRLNDRVLIGGMTQSDAKYPPAALDWFMQYEESIGYSNPTLAGVMCVSTSPSAAAAESVAGTFAAQSLTSTSAGASCIPVEAFAVNNNESYSTNAWAFYGEAHKTNATAGSVYGMELDVMTVVNGGQPTPSQQGTSVGIQIGAGAGIKGARFSGFIGGNTLTVASQYTPEPGYTPAPGDSVLGAGVAAGTIITAVITAGTYTVNISQTVSQRNMIVASQADAAAAIQIVNNPTRWGVGINFTSSSIVGCDGTNGQGVAIALAKGHTLQWYTPAGNPGPSVLSTVSDPTKLTGINFTDSGAQVYGPGAATLAMFAPTPGAANYFQFTAGAAGSAVEIAAAGTDANINLKLTPKGTGSVQIGAAYTAGAVSQTGYVTMLDASGTPRRFLIG